MPKPSTDFQRSRIWDAERNSGFPDLTDGEIIELTTRVVKSAWFRKQAVTPEARNCLAVSIQRMPQYTHCEVGFQPMQRRQGATPANILILKLGDRERSLPEVLHPLVHCISPDTQRFWHNQPFVKAWLAMIARFAGPDTKSGVAAKKKFQAVLKQHKVKATVYSDEARAAKSDAAKAKLAREDLIALREELASSNI